MRALSFLLGALACSTCVAGQFGSFIYSESGGKITITGLVNFGAGSNGTVPGTINGKPVTAIGDFGLSGWAYSSITLPNSVTSVGYSSFAAATELRQVNLGTGLTVIGDGAFFACGQLQSVTLPSGLTSLGDSSFASCGALTSITIPAKLTHIGDQAFAYCPKLVSFTVAPGNPVFSSLRNSCYDKAQTTLVLCPSSSSGLFLVPNSVTVLGADAFAGNTVVQEVRIGPKVAQILEGAFWGCSALTAITVDPANTGFTSADGVCFDKTQSTLVAFPGGKSESYVVPATVTTIGGRAFAANHRLKSIQLPAGLTRIGYEAFRECNFLTSITIPAGVTRLDAAAFGGCANLAKILFTGNAPSQVGTRLLDGTKSPTVYYRAGTTGWTSTFAGRPTQVWNPTISTDDPAFGAGPDGFTFRVTGAPNIPALVEASIDLAGTVWTPLKTVALTNGSVTINDPAWTKYPTRFYRLRFP